MDKYNMYTKDLSPNNVNFRLTDLYKKRDKIGEQIDKYMIKGYSTEEIEHEYEVICDVIKELCDFRNTCGDCALEGDHEYGFV